MSLEELTENKAQITRNTTEDCDRFPNDQWFVALYNDLRRIAERELRRQSGATLSPTTLLHETFLDVSRRDAVAFPDRARFLVYASRAMRGLIIDYARKRQAHKRGGHFEITSLPTHPQALPNEDLQLEKLNDALESLAQIDAQLAECVDLKFFCGFSFVEIAELRNVSERTVQRRWDQARVLLHRLMKDPAGAASFLL